MFENISIAAEKLATNVGESRRGFLGSLGKVALGAAGVLGALLVSPENAAANGPEFCFYRCPDGTTCRIRVAFAPNCGRCPKTLTGGGQTCRFWYCTIPD